MIKTRRLIAIVCIALILVTGMMPAGAALLRGVLVPLGLLFGTIISVPLPDAADTELAAAPVLSVGTSRARRSREDRRHRSPDCARSSRCRLF